MKQESEKMGVVHFDVPQQQKGGWIKAAQREDMKLIPWIKKTLDDAARSESAPHAAREGGGAQR